MKEIMANLEWWEVILKYVQLQRAAVWLINLIWLIWSSECSASSTVFNEVKCINKTVWQVSSLLMNATIKDKEMPHDSQRKIIFFILWSRLLTEAVASYLGRDILLRSLSASSMRCKCLHLVSLLRHLWKFLTWYASARSWYEKLTDCMWVWEGEYSHLHHWQRMCNK